MSDPEKPADDVRAEAAFAMAKHAFERALVDPAEQAALARRKRNKRIAQVAIGALVVVGLLGLMLNYWYWSLLLGLVGVVALYARHRWRARRAASKLPKTVTRSQTVAPKVRVEAEAERAVEPDSSVEDELAELKSRLDR